MKSESRWRLLLMQMSLSLLSILLIFATDRGLKHYYYSKTYRYYEAGEVYVEDENTQLLFSRDRHLFWKIKPNIEMKITENPTQYALHAVDDKKSSYFFTVKSNSAGLNSPEISNRKPAGTVRIVTLGDSRTMAEGVEFDKLYARVLEDALNDLPDRSSVQVINGGVSGYSSYQGLVSLKRDLIDYEPDYVTVLFGINDQDVDLGISDRERATEFDTPLNTIHSWANRSMIYYFALRQTNRLKGRLFGKTPVQTETDEAIVRTVRRVSLGEYEDNLNEFVDLGAQHGFTAIFLIVPTSPYAFFPSLFGESLASLTPDHDLEYQRAYALFQQGSIEESATVLERILEKQDSAPIRHTLAMIYLELGRDDEAHTQFVAMNERIIFNRYANVVRKVAAQRGAPLIDLTPEFTVRITEPLYVDDMHPGDHGQQLIARKIADAFANGSIPKPTRPGG